MALVLSKAIVGVLVVFVVVSASAAGYWHDSSIKGVYNSLALDRSQLDAQYRNQIGSLDNQVQQLQSQTRFTLVLGTVRSSGTPQNIFFEARSGQTLSSAAVYDYTQFRYTYQLFLKSGETYGVSISYSGVFSEGSCAGVPVVITPTGSSYTQNFECRE
jgi:hypothetical protein